MQENGKGQKIHIYMVSSRMAEFVFPTDLCLRSTDIFQSAVVPAQLLLNVCHVPSPPNKVPRFTPQK